MWGQIPGRRMVGDAEGGVKRLFVVRCDPMIFYADILFNYARKAYLGIGDDTPERDGDQLQTVPAIIFSVTALEAFINEVGALAVRNASVFSVTPEARVFAAEWEENGGGSPLRSKFIRAKHILTPEDYNLKATPFRDFSHLLTLRDALVHMTPREETKIEDGRIKIEPWQWVDKHLGPKGILVDCDPTENNWVYRITTKAVARWACTTTEAMIETLIQGVQDYRLRLDLHSHFEGAFALPPPSTDPP